MREIRFRAWNGEKMIDPLSVFMPYDGTINHTNGGFTLMQFTGLLDKNGNEIYEDDIIFVEYNYIGKDIVSFDKGKYNICNYNLSGCKILGNRFENPELLSN